MAKGDIVLSADGAGKVGIRSSSGKLALFDDDATACECCGNANTVCNLCYALLPGTAIDVAVNLTLTHRPIGFPVDGQPVLWSPSQTVSVNKIWSPNFATGIVEDHLAFVPELEAYAYKIVGGGQKGVYFVGQVFASCLLAGGIEINFRLVEAGIDWIGPAPSKPWPVPPPGRGGNIIWWRYSGEFTGCNSTYTLTKFSGMAVTENAPITVTLNGT